MGFSERASVGLVGGLKTHLLRLSFVPLLWLTLGARSEINLLYNLASSR
jgi:hypothetical protein